MTGAEIGETWLVLLDNGIKIKAKKVGHSKWVDYRGRTLPDRVYGVLHKVN